MGFRLYLSAQEVSRRMQFLYLTPVAMLKPTFFLRFFDGRTGRGEWFAIDHGDRLSTLVIGAGFTGNRHGVARAPSVGEPLSPSVMMSARCC